MKEFFEKNIAALRAKDRSLALLIEHAPDDGTVIVLEGKSGPVPEIVAGGKTVALHSRIDPVREATRFVSQINPQEFDLFIVSGFGFAYHIEDLLQRVGNDAVVLVMEKNPLLIQKACAHRDLAGIFGDSRCVLLLSPSEDDIARALQGKSTRRTAFLLHRGSHQADAEFYSNTLRIARSYLSTKDVNIATLAKFEKTWMQNIARNAGYLADLPRAKFFYGAFENIPAIVAAAGPSLSESMNCIRKNSSRALIIAVDTSYRILRKHGIEPHFCITVDPQAVNARYFEGDAISRTILVADPSSHPSVFKLFKGRMVRAGTAFPMMKWIDEICGEGGEIAHGGSVSTNAYDFAKRLGASPVVLVGQDLAFTGGYAHARGSYLDDQVHLRTERFFTAEMFNRRQLTALPKIFVDGIRSGKVHTNQKMMIFLSWFERRNDPALFNATVHGARMKGVAHVDEADIDFGNIKDLWRIADTVYEKAKLQQQSSKVRLLLDKKCAKMEADVEELLPILGRAVHLSENLAEQTASANRDGAKIAYIIKKLDEADRAIESMKKTTDMIGLTIQKVVHTIMEGHDVGEEDRNMNDDEKIARRSLYLYRGLLEGAEFVRRIAGQMKTILKNTRSSD